MGPVVKWLFAFGKSYLLNMPLPDLQKDSVENFIDKEKVTLGDRFEEFWDCPLCLEQFKPEDEIIALKCHEKHIYHVNCLESALLLSREQKCALCRAEITLEAKYLDRLESAEPGVAAAPIVSSEIV